MDNMDNIDDIDDMDNIDSHLATTPKNTCHTADLEPHFTLPRAHETLSWRVLSNIRLTGRDALVKPLVTIVCLSTQTKIDFCTGYSRFVTLLERSANVFVTNNEDSVLTIIRERSTMTVFLLADPALAQPNHANTVYEIFTAVCYGCRAITIGPFTDAISAGAPADYRHFFSLFDLPWDLSRRQQDSYEACMPTYQGWEEELAGDFPRHIYMRPVCLSNIAVTDWLYAQVSTTGTT
ncbi:hypothetical protein F66182_9325 [Fusarium sp. NRRL 66182]|nr:hypothetical protein F66182_9325 [Fusarium sp. NRRL 66182]